MIEVYSGTVVRIVRSRINQPLIPAPTQKLRVTVFFLIPRKFYAVFTIAFLCNNKSNTNSSCVAVALPFVVPSNNASARTHEAAASPC